MPETHAHTNSLINESSPYLLQHAHNPVDWHAWGDAALEKAEREDKLILVSIGYSACHWCHVMERESFEDEGMAALMNERFVCIKVDREERPDVDQVYMNAVQLLSGQGGWPLNCFALPDGRPVYGGTYYRPAQWKDVLLSLSDLWKNDRAKALKYAEQLTEGVRNSERIGGGGGEEGGREPGGRMRPHSLDEARAMVEAWKPLFDRSEGGMKRAPKFPLPSNWRFLLRYGEAAGDEVVRRQVRLTLDKMARGGIYDHLGGGFARYSTDGLWKAPHFEKMLYDNAQLLELYAEAYQATGDPLYKTVIKETAAFVARELTSPEGAFWSALDADSEGEEGKYYVWTREELEKVLGDRFPPFRDAYSVNPDGYWEEGHYILLKRKTDAELAAAAGLEEDEWRMRIDRDRKELLALREKRIRPGLDDKTLIGWNAMMAKGLLAAHAALGEDKYLEAARRNLEFILGRARTADGGLFRTYKAGTRPGGGFAISAFLEDYAFAAEAFLSLYQATFEEKWAAAAKDMAEYAIVHFRDGNSGLFFFTSDQDKPLIARKMEITDNVIPSSNSVLGRVLLHLASLYGEDRYRDIAETMLERVRAQLPTYGSGFSNWGMVLLDLALPFHEMVITGPETADWARSLRRRYLPDAVLAGEDASKAGEDASKAGEDASKAGSAADTGGGTSGGSLPLLEGRFRTGKTLIYVCRNRACGLPAESVAAALTQLGRRSA